MTELEEKLGGILAAGPRRILLSAPREKGAPGAELTLVAGGWRLTQMKGAQAFHSTHTPAQLPALLAGLLETAYTQLTAFTPAAELRLRLTKKGKALTSKSALQQKETPVQDVSPQTHGEGEAPEGHNRQKNYLLPEGQPIPALVDLGIFTPDGRVVKRMYDKYRQVNRFVELVEDSLRGEAKTHLRVVEFGCGKSALSFALYHYLTAVRGFTVEMVGLDLKEDVVARCEEAARRYGYTGLHFACGDIAHYTRQDGADLMLCLHACNTATDEALARAVSWGAQRIFAVPCCQHQLNAQMQSEEFSLLTRYGILQERTAALFTDAIRANLLCAAGYKCQVLEFVGLDNTPKNLLLRAVKTGQRAAVRQKALDEVARLCNAFHLQPALLGLLQNAALL